MLGPIIITINTLDNINKYHHLWNIKELCVEQMDSIFNHPLRATGALFQLLHHFKLQENYLEKKWWRRYDVAFAKCDEHDDDVSMNRILWLQQLETRIPFCSPQLYLELHAWIHCLPSIHLIGDTQLPWTCTCVFLLNSCGCWNCVHENKSIIG